MDFTSLIIPSLRAIAILSKVEDFQEWLKTNHVDVDISTLLPGYIFSIQCCLYSFSEGIENDKNLQLEEDFLFQRARAEIIPIHKVESTCEKIIFLKKVKLYIKDVSRSTTYDELQSQVNKFADFISFKILSIANQHLQLNPDLKLSRNEADHLLLIDFIHTYLVQCNFYGPVGNSSNLLNAEPFSEARSIKLLEGYKYAIQFLWWKILDEKTYRGTSLIKLHTAASWKKYIYEDTIPENDPMAFMLGRSEFDLNKQDSLDSYFFRIMNEITNPLTSYYSFEVYTIDTHFTFNNVEYDKSLYFNNLHERSFKSDVFSTLSWEDKIRTTLYWYSYSIIKSAESASQLGITSFSTALAGTVTLHSKESEFDKVLVAKFKHPRVGAEHGSDYSYGVLMDSQASAGHADSGWVIYLNVCGDYSGFSKREHSTAENLIRKYCAAEKIELRELNIPLKKFQAFVSKYVSSEREISILKQNKLIPDIIQKSRAYVFELFVYYLHVTSHGNRFKVQLNIDQKSIEGEKDIVLENDNEVILIECKLNVNTINDLSQLAEKMRHKESIYKDKIVTSELWLWKTPSTRSEAVLREKNIKTVVVSNDRTSSMLKGVALERLKFIMQDY